MPDSGTSRQVVTKIKDKLGLTLVNQGVVSSEIVINALAVKEKNSAGHSGIRASRGLAQILAEDFNIDRDAVFGAVAKVYGFREISLTEEDTNEERVKFMKKMIELLPESSREYMANKQIMPFRYDKLRPYKLIFIAADPTDRMIPVLARAMKVQTYDVCYVAYSEMMALLEKVMPRENLFLKELEDNPEQFSDADIEEEDLDEALLDAEINKSLLVNLAEGMLIEAVRVGASDIHIVPKNSGSTDIHFRIDGMLRPWHSQEGIRPEAISAVMKDRSKNVDRFERERAQDGFIQRKIDDHSIRYRVSIMPIVGSEYQYKFESIVIRILDDRSVITDLDKLGFHGIARASFLKAIKQPQGMVIVTGPTGSGKSTTLIAALSHIVTPEINVLTVEDPVEYIIPGVRQLKISPKMNFEAALRSILRHDPDVVMLGEIRDKETGETAIKLANTGHLTFSTLHTNDAPSAVSRLYKMGIETFLIAYAINIIIAQRLMRRLCSKCKKQITEFDEKFITRLHFTMDELRSHTIYEPVGCDHCHNGYKGRVAVHEALYFTKAIRRMIFEAKGDINEEVIKEQAIKDGMMTLQESARMRVFEGTTSFDEVARVTSDD
ncbi:MAG: Flp pilus assembly complex ATPase component TadA [Calditrichaeota bacterium]|nr:Flp pilus assembly complex ATPase component TadA [Calditrichota bacterium]MBT7788739.1 Flp pilus assembly complex ATPase component TadA [Calditrichota bacterium]